MTVIRTFMFSLCLLQAMALAPPSGTGAPIGVQSVLFDSDANVRTIGPLNTNSNDIPVMNGDFTITRVGSNTVTGNGVDEWTQGLFDFRDDSNYSAFVGTILHPRGKIVSAILQLFVSPPFGTFGYLNDQVRLDDGPFRGDPSIGSEIHNTIPIPDTEFRRINVDMLEFYSPDLLESLLSDKIGTVFGFSDDGRLLLTYADDAIISLAALRLSADIVSEPETAMIFSLGLMLFGLSLRRRSASRRLPF